MAKRAKPRPGRPTRPTRAQARRIEPSVATAPAIRPPAAAGAPPPPAPPAAALATFEQGLRALERHAFAEAADTMRAILGSFPGERALLDRARMYLDLCERELRRKPAVPRTVEERLTAATAALNDGDDDRAAELARSVVRDDDGQDLAHYLLATVAARRGVPDEALSHLARSISLSPEAGAQARFDTDFESLRDHETFRKLTEPPPNSPSPSGRRLRRGRPER
jgi:tetratricopeptide (TPR) repeat protein